MHSHGKITVGVELEEDFPTRFAAALQQAADEFLGNVASAVDGYRQSCLDRGYDGPAAEAMAVQYHTLLMVQVGSAYASQARAAD